MSEPRITVVIPCRNAEETLEPTLCSVLDQGYRNLEMIVVDGNSTDQTVEVIRHFDQEIEHWISEPDGGPADAINKALRMATGELFAIIPCDDVVMPLVLDGIARVWSAHESPWLVGHTQVVDEGMNVLGRLRGRRVNSLAAMLSQTEPCIAAASSYYATQLLREVGGFDDTLRYAWPYDMACRLTCAGYEPLVVTEDLSAVLQTQESLSAESALQRGRESVIVAERYMDELSDRAERAGVWQSCDDRRRILAIAEAEAFSHRAQSLLLRRVRRRPWWLRDKAIRQVLSNGPTHALDSKLKKAA